MKPQFVLAVAALALLAAGPAAAPVNNLFDSAWSRGALWDDGQAEVTLYDAQRPQYGKIVSYQTLFIVVKEDFDAKLHVKADPPYERRALIPVLKLNAVHSYWTDRYPYNFLASVFVRRDDPQALVKLTLGSQEWCGNTFKLLSTRGRPELHFHTYFDGPVDETRPLDLRPGDLFEDQLPLALRGLEFAPGLTLRRRIFPSLISNNVRQEPVFHDTSITVVGEEIVATGAGRLAAWKVTLQMGDLIQTWWFEKSAPHAMLKMESSDGRAWLLRSRTRKAYWREPTFHPEQ